MVTVWFPVIVNKSVVFIKITSCSLLHGSSNYLHFPCLRLLEQLSPAPAPKGWVQAQRVTSCVHLGASSSSSVLLRRWLDVRPCLCSFLPNLNFSVIILIMATTLQWQRLWEGRVSLTNEKTVESH